MNVTKADLAKRLQERTSLNKTQALNMVQDLLDIMGEELQAGNDIELRGFGKFHIKPTPVRMGRNPKTKEPVEIPAGFKVKFKLSSTLKVKG